MASNELRRAVSERVFVRQDGKTGKVTAYILRKVRRGGVSACRIFMHRLEDDMIQIPVKSAKLWRIGFTNDARYLFQRPDLELDCHRVPGNDSSQKCR
jgi:hypothetical protein